MGFFSKLKFWKKDDDDFALDKPLEKDFSIAEKSLFPETELASSPLKEITQSRDLELINSKLDTLKAMLAAVEQRLANLEQAMAAEKKQKLW